MAGRFQDITIEALAHAGAKKYCWLHPREVLKADLRGVFKKFAGGPGARAAGEVATARLGEVLAFAGLSHDMTDAEVRLVFPSTSTLELDPLQAPAVFVVSCAPSARWSAPRLAARADL
jgi:hypothetical protein